MKDDRHALRDHGRPRPFVPFGRRSSGWTTVKSRDPTAHAERERSSFRLHPSSFRLQAIPGMRVLWHLDPKRIDGGMGAAEEGAQVRAAESEAHRLLGE